MTTLQSIHLAWSRRDCPHRKAPDQCNKWRADAPYVAAVATIDPDTVLRSTRPLPQNGPLDPQLERAYSKAFGVWIAPPVTTQFHLRDSAAAAWRGARPDISSREHNQKWRDKFIRLAFEMLHGVLIVDPGRVPTGQLLRDDEKPVEQILAWAQEASEASPEGVPATNPLRLERVEIAAQWRPRLVSRAGRLGLSLQDAEDAAGEAILNYLTSSPSDDVPLLWKQLDYAIKRHHRVDTRMRRLVEKIQKAYGDGTVDDAQDAARPLGRLSAHASCIVEAVLGDELNDYTQASFLTALERGDVGFAALPDSDKVALLEAALGELRTQLGGGEDA